MSSISWISVAQHLLQGVLRVYCLLQGVAKEFSSLQIWRFFIQTKQIHHARKTRQAGKYPNKMSPSWKLPKVNVYSAGIPANRQTGTLLLVCKFCKWRVLSVWSKEPSQKQHFFQGSECTTQWTSQIVRLICHLMTGRNLVCQTSILPKHQRARVLHEVWRGLNLYSNHLSENQKTKADDRTLTKHWECSQWRLTAYKFSGGRARYEKQHLTLGIQSEEPGMKR